jgi:hypothetical protein
MEKKFTMFQKRFLLPGLLAAGLLGGLYQAPQTAAFDDNNKATPVASLPKALTGDKEELADLLVKMAAISAKLMETGYTVVHIEVDRLQKGQIYSASRTLHGGNSYKIVGLGGKGIGDLDMKLVDSDGDTVAKDTEADNVPIVDIAPKTEGSYTVKVAAAAIEKGFDPESEYYFCWVIAFKRAG